MTQRSSRETAGSSKGVVGIWFVLAIGWFVIVIGSAFLLGGLALALPFIPGLQEWSKTITLYDLFSGVGYYFAVLMAIIGAITALAVAETHPDEIDLIVIGISLLGVVILILLIVGKFISG